jgi:hypothetical protein
VAALARGDDIEASRLAGGLDDAFALVAGRFFRREVRARARACVAGMLSGLARKTGWPLAEHAGEDCPDGMPPIAVAYRGSSPLLSAITWKRARGGCHARDYRCGLH